MIFGAPQLRVKCGLVIFFEEEELAEAVKAKAQHGDAGNADMQILGSWNPTWLHKSTFAIIFILFFQDFESECFFGSQIVLLKIHQFYNPPVVLCFFRGLVDSQDQPLGYTELVPIWYIVGLI